MGYGGSIIPSDEQIYRLLLDKVQELERKIETQDQLYERDRNVFEEERKSWEDDRKSWENDRKSWENDRKSWHDKERLYTEDRKNWMNQAAAMKKQRRDDGSRRRLCTFYLKGKCKFGGACTFSHSPNRISAEPRSQPHAVVPPPITPFGWRCPIIPVPTGLVYTVGPQLLPQLPPIHPPPQYNPTMQLPAIHPPPQYRPTFVPPLLPQLPPIHPPPLVPRPAPEPHQRPRSVQTFSSKQIPTPRRARPQPPRNVVPPPAPTTQQGRNICPHYLSKYGCRAGDECNMSHFGENGKIKYKVFDS